MPMPTPLASAAADLSAWLGFETLPRPLAFRGAPARVICARALADVIPALEAVEAATTRDGLHAVGQVAYEAAPAFEPSMAVHARANLPDFPLLYFALFAPEAVTEEPLPTSASSSSSSPSSPSSSSPPPRVTVGGPWEPDATRERYDAAIGSIRASIRDGEAYQVNHTLRLHAPLALTHPGDPVPFLVRLLAAQRCGYGAYLRLGELLDGAPSAGAARYHVLSASPEQFFHWSRATGRISTRPMKGTRKRGLSAAEDAVRRAELQASEKDRAENLMIVDLLRNDLSRIASKGSVRVSDMFKLEAYPTVFQMTSTVSATTRDGVGLVDVFRALFPCGSVTGAPKISAMRIIAALEDSSRHTYCGAIVHVAPGPGGAVSASVPIRTVLFDAEAGRGLYGVGGGITWDSTAQGEYEEVLAKAAVLVAAGREEGWGAAASASAGTTASTSSSFALLETMRADTGSGGGGDPLDHRVAYWAGHLARLRASAEYFGYKLEEAAVSAAVESALNVAGADVGPLRLRLTLTRAGEVAVTTSPLPVDPASASGSGSGTEPKVAVLLSAEEPVAASSDVFLYHKTTVRGVYDGARERAIGAWEARRAATGDADAGPCFDALLVNARGEVTEFCIGNLVAEMPGEGPGQAVPEGVRAGWPTPAPGHRFATPPVAAGLLPGVFREHLLASRYCGIAEETLTVEDVLERARRVWLVNSVREWVEVRVVRV
jgi:para-aminobenzoate synthetase / 4-amino-4-deoxychorismate lyase